METEYTTSQNHVSSYQQSDCNSEQNKDNDYSQLTNEYLQTISIEGEEESETISIEDEEES